MASQSRAIRSQSQIIVKFEKFMAQIFLNCESTSDWTDVIAWIYDRKTAVRHFETIHDVLRYLSLVKTLLKGQNAPAGINAYEIVGNRRVKNGYFLIKFKTRPSFVWTLFVNFWNCRTSSRSHPRRNLRNRSSGQACKREKGYLCGISYGHELIKFQKNYTTLLVAFLTTPAMPSKSLLCGGSIWDGSIFSSGNFSWIEQII